MDPQPAKGHPTMGDFAEALDRLIVEHFGRKRSFTFMMAPTDAGGEAYFLANVSRASALLMAKMQVTRLSEGRH